jgi:glycosyltransferase involved in cell wall biosynthesis
MRIVGVKVGGLWPVNAGGRLRSFHMIRELSERHQVTLFTTHGPAEDPAGLAAQLPRCEVISLPFTLAKLGSARFAGALVGSWTSTSPLDLWRARVPALRRAVRQRVAAGDVDLCVADFMTATPNLPVNGPVPVVLFEHNVEYVIWQRLSLAEPGFWRRVPLELEWRKMRAAEARACTAAAATIAVSEVDRALLAELAPSARIRAVPTGVDTRYFAPNGFHEQPDTLVFTGSMDWYPNESALTSFFETILPRIRREVPAVQMAVVGRNPTARLRAAAAAAGVQVTGTVDDIRPHMARAAVYVVPLQVGGGTRIKIFEALAMGKALVSTTVGAEGLPITPGEHFVQADDPSDFAAAVVSLLRNPAQRRALGLAGRRLVEEKYGWASVTREFEARCEEVLSHAR